MSSAADLRRTAAALFGLDIPPGDAERLTEFVSLLEKWSRRLNLVSAASRTELIDRHVLDSLAAAAFVREREILADVGSGAGLPGIPLALVRPVTGWLIESRAKRASFLRQAIRSLGITTLRVFTGRAETFDASPVDVAIARAVDARTIASFATRSLSPGGRLLLMRKVGQTDPAVGGFCIAERSEYRLPAGERHEIVVLRRDSCST